MTKPTLGIFSFSCCSGCQIAIINQEKILLELLSKFDIVHFHLMKKKYKEGPYDIAIVEGSITQKDQIPALQDIREKAKILVAIGACAVEGGVQSIRNFEKEAKFSKAELKNPRYKDLIDSKGIDQYVKVDYYVRGCPITKQEFTHVVKQLLLGKKPDTYEFPVCSECREKGNRCFLLDGIPCMGPITHGGCEAVCTSYGVPCEGCRGPIEDAHYQAHIALLKKMGMKKEEMTRMFIKFAGNKLYPHLKNGK